MGRFRARCIIRAEIYHALEGIMTGLIQAFKGLQGAFVVL